ncbi:hypothetical protein M441DRAFT_424453 [Trichoderma asperellum CBS 433.97]|uniref:Secreted protein n=1 Tax=Trichoderma asperellum (strain ATCC 204424 / CBS 433.97 / NBRC 101777) TaxID=1042311 RepID=A0A2T3Z5B6_TRIA4|nr:hypothetical protein M441DRAFT_424453 [Trichoderma asperellum CBS 433.97]PTB39987.1 hypothetical protein M441DRAFT_424453 [Trichoderma asperellum CBS 433.97]
MSLSLSPAVISLAFLLLHDMHLASQVTQITSPCITICGSESLGREKGSFLQSLSFALSAHAYTRNSDSLFGAWWEKGNTGGARKIGVLWVL